MAFNFNWSPLIADTSRARDMLTTALNKSPKPPIIVDDIIVTELNLGTVPPELEILEIGDLAEDRFRGIFKMSYTGDAYLTLKTRVQANPLNTYLSTKPSFASPQPLAASSSLTIPLQITLSDIRLSGFVILVFSREKGITLVFRNDPLESLKVSSTFDSIPFVRDYLQKEIEGQLRVLFMEDLPAIIHRLSLRLWSPEYASREEEEQNKASRSNEQPIDPLASPPMNACDAFGRPIEDSELSSLSLDNNTETHATFSQKNLLRLAALTDSHRTLALFTPPIRDAVFRAWAGAAERGDTTGTSTPIFSLASLSRQHSVPTSASSMYGYSDSVPQLSRRPSIGTSHSSYAGTNYSTTSKSRSHAGRRRKNRVVDLRRPQPESTPELPSIITCPTTPPPRTPSSSYAASSAREGEMDTPPQSPETIKKAHVRIAEQSATIHSPRPRPTLPSRKSQMVLIDPEDATEDAASVVAEASASSSGSPTRHRRPSAGSRQAAYRAAEKQRAVSPLPTVSGSPPGGILEQAWMMKMATEISRKVREEKMKEARTEWRKRMAGEDADAGEGERPPPPAYAA